MIVTTPRTMETPPAAPAQDTLTGTTTTGVVVVGGGVRGKLAKLDRFARKKRVRAIVFVLAVLAIVLARPATQHARATSLLMSFSDPNAKPAVTEERITFSAANGEKIPARLYIPMGIDHPPGVVLVHGVHHGGIEEPRLERFARAVAASGVVVMTPAVKELSDYKVAPHSIETVGVAVDSLRTRLGSSKVGLMGMSFGGGISLLAASDARWVDRVSFVVAVGAHDDLGRVSRFFINDEIPEPNGETKKLRAHGYGVMVIAYSHVSDFFPAEDVPAAREALRLWLWEKRDDARKAALALSPASKAKMDNLFDVGVGTMKPELLAEIESHTADMKEVSPHGRLGTIRANVYLLHGESDSVIPATETLWLAEDVPADRLRTALVSPAIEHVELKSPSVADKWALIHFMGQVIAEADESH
jgi:pimeloyl-ACP methyl ester carboxylesterase